MKSKQKPLVKETTQHSNLVSTDSFPDEVEEGNDDWREHWKQIPSLVMKKNHHSKHYVSSQPVDLLG